MPGLIVHEWFAKTGGSEKVVEQMLDALPHSDLQVLWNDRDPRERPAHETWISRTPLRKSKALALPFLLPTWRLLPARQRYDWMLVSSHLFAHHARLRGQHDIPKLVYAHTPARYIWTPEFDERGASLPVRAASAILRPIDRRRSREATRVAANSQFTRERIRATWGIDADVMYPPIDTERISGTSSWETALSESDQTILRSLPQEFLLGASRMIPYKRLDDVIRSGEATSLPVVLAGSGPEWEALKAQGDAASVPVHLVHRPSDALLFTLYQKCIAFVFPAIEDFGIMPVEAMAAGAPVIVPSVGGAAESVGLIKGGAIIERFDAANLRSALDMTSKVDRAALRTRVDRFSNTTFREHLQTWLRDHTR